MSVFQCGACDGTICTLVIVGNDDLIDGDDLACPRRTTNYLPEWRKLTEVK